MRLTNPSSESCSSSRSFLSALSLVSFLQPLYSKTKKALLSPFVTLNLVLRFPQSQIEENSETMCNTESTGFERLMSSNAENLESAVMRVRGIGYSNDVFDRHHRSRFSFEGREYISVAQMAAFTVAQSTGNDSAAKEVLEGPSVVERKYGDMGLCLVEDGDPDGIEIVVRAVILACTAKFSSTAPLLETLAASQERVVVDCSADDMFWSVGYYTGTGKVSSVKDWGHNMLGRAIMTVRFVLAAGDRIARVGDEKVAEMSADAARVHKLTSLSDWESFTEELKNEMEKKRKAEPR